MEGGGCVPVRLAGVTEGDAGAGGVGGGGAAAAVKVGRLIVIREMGLA